MKAGLICLAAFLAGCATSPLTQQAASSDDAANDAFYSRYDPPDRHPSMPEPSGISPAGRDYEY